MSEKDFCEDYVVRFLLMYNTIEMSKIEDIETAKKVKQARVFQMNLPDAQEIMMLDRIDAEYEMLIGRLVDELKTKFPEIIKDTMMELNKSLIQNYMTSNKLGLQVPQSISQFLSGLDYYLNYKKCSDQLQKLEIFEMK